MFHAFALSIVSYRYVYLFVSMYVCTNFVICFSAEDKVCEGTHIMSYWMTENRLEVRTPSILKPSLYTFVFHTL